MMSICAQIFPHTTLIQPIHRQRSACEVENELINVGLTVKVTEKINIGDIRNPRL